MDGMDKITTSIIALLTAVLGVSALAVLMSRQSNTSQVIGTGAQGFATILKTALSPIGGGGGILGGLLGGSGIGGIGGFSGGLGFGGGFMGL